MRGMIADIYLQIWAQGVPVGKGMSYAQGSGLYNLKQVVADNMRGVGGSDRSRRRVVIVGDK